MRQLLGIARSLLRGGGRRTLLDLALTVFGVAIPVAVTFLVLGTIAGFSDREDRTAWREPTEASTGEATALQRLVYHPWQGKRVDVVELREIAPGTPPPPGMDRMPGPGEIWVSPALAGALGGDTRRFEERLGGEIAGVLGAPALAHEADLVAVVGNPALEPSGERLPFDHRVMGGFVSSDVIPVAGFATEGSDPGLPADYRLAALVAGALLVAPSMTLVGAAVRLTAARRGRRLAALRLAGATAGEVRVIAAVETLVGAVAGLVLGWGLSVVGAMLASRVSLAGGRFDWSDLLARPVAVAAVVLVALLIALLSSMIALRDVAASPLGVVRQTRGRRPGWMRVLVMLGAFALLFASIPLARGTGAGWVMVPGIAAIILSIATVGPLFTWALGRIGVAVARGPRSLMAGRRLMSDPGGSFRPTAGIVLISFVAGFILVGMASMPDTEGDRPTYIYGATVGQVPVEEEVVDALASIPGIEIDEDAGSVRLPVGTDLEEGRDLLAGVIGALPITAEEMDHDLRVFAADLRKGTGVVVLIALVQAAFATGVGAAGSILEQSNTLAALNLAGTPMGALQSARALQAAAPITLASGVMVFLGVLAGGATILGATSRVSPVVPALAQAGLVVMGAVAAGLLGTALTRPVLAQVIARPLAER